MCRPFDLNQKHENLHSDVGNHTLGSQGVIGSIVLPDYALLHVGF